MATRKPKDGPKDGPRDPAAKSPRRRRARVEGLLGIGLDGKDGHTRITQGEGFVLLGGSPETHEKMQDLTIRLTERLKKKGKRIRDASVQELRDLSEDL